MSPSTLIVEGALSGNHINVQGAGGYLSTPCDGSQPRSTTFTATFPEFFTHPQTPSVVMH
ncbi:hypothetical protein F0U60_53525 [Archangium minus]|uniref:Uncharacterized protein n=1 Tax=Archangium minus TaxID=83450 RepID=A0ABY9X9B0_9BACT|nr:hypothetical protein F0U60_53525 [Archangium minus]